MTFLRRFRFSQVILVLILACLGSCKPAMSDHEQIVGLWGMGYITSNGMIVSEGKEWFDFQENDVIESRSAPASYQRGYWHLNPAQHTLTLGEKGLDSLVYQYSLIHDTLRMEATMKTINHVVGLLLVKIPKKLIDRDVEMQMGAPQ